MAGLQKIGMLAAAAVAHIRIGRERVPPLLVVVPMAPLIEATGLVAALLTTFAFLPQVVQTLRTRSARGLNLPMLAVLTAGLVLWLIYGLGTLQMPVILANGATLVLVAVLLGFKLRELRLAR
jgi:MtN3 and saliva related transmembrane protein